MTEENTGLVHTPAEDPTKLFPRERANLTQYQLRVYPQIKTHGQALIVKAKARELGLPETFVADHLYWIEAKDGGLKPSWSGQMIAAYIKMVGKYRYRPLKKTREICEIEFLEKMPDGTWEVLGTETWDATDSKLAGLETNYGHRKYPKAMKQWRCLTAGLRFYCPDALLGEPIYTADEFDGSLYLDDDGAVHRAPPDKATPAEVAEIEALIKSTGADADRLRSHYKVTALADLSSAAAAQALAFLKIKAAAQPEVADAEVETKEENA